MKIQISNSIVSDALILIGCGATVAGAWCLGWEAGLLVTGLAVIVVGWVLRGVEIMGYGKRRRK